MMTSKSRFVAGAALVLATLGNANALDFNVAQGTSFNQVLNVTPTKSNWLSFQIAGLGSQFTSLSFSFEGISGLTQTAKLVNGSWSAAFNDYRNNSFFLNAGQTYKVDVIGQTAPGITGGFGTITVQAVNGTAALVPEPETYAMMLAGLGMMGFIVSRRRNLRS